MKAEFDREIDALLRRSLRAAGKGARAPRGEDRATPHLDADELSAFAEHALPEPARLAAVVHLADCDECRGAVVTLSRAAGEPLPRAAAAPVPVDPSEAVPAGGWLAALFSPRLLRFVAPALALCLVGAVAFILLRARREGAGSIASRSPEHEAVRPGITTDAGAGAGANANLSNDANTGTTPVETAEPEAEPRLATQTPRAEAERLEAAGVAAEPETPDGAEGGRVADALARQPQPVAAEAREEPPPSPPPPAAAPVEAAPVASAPPPAVRDIAKEKPDESRKAAEDDEAARVAEGPPMQDRRAQTGNLELQSPDGSRNRSANNSNYGGLSAQPVPRRAPDRTNRSNRGGSARGESREAEAAGSERAVAGHRFRREGNAWVDVNYRSSMAMTGVRRGTEAFRALIADIPELGRIAEQLSGEVITVVRGRAYRIR